MAYTYLNAEHTSVRKDDGEPFAWDPALMQPVDIEGPVGQQWITDGRPFPPPFIVVDPRTQAFRDDSDRQALVNVIKDATPAQIKTFITNNVTDLPSARAMLVKLALLVALSTRD